MTHAEIHTVVKNANLTAGRIRGMGPRVHLGGGGKWHSQPDHPELTFVQARYYL